MEGVVSKEVVDKKGPLVELIKYSEEHKGRWPMGLVGRTVVAIPAIDKEITAGNKDTLMLLGDLLKSTRKYSLEAEWAGMWLGRYKNMAETGDVEYLTCVLENATKVDDSLEEKALNWVEKNLELTRLMNSRNLRLSRAYWKARADNAYFESWEGKDDGENLSSMGSVLLGDDEDLKDQVIKNGLSDYREVGKDLTLTRLMSMVVSLGIGKEIAFDMVQSWMSYEWEKEDPRITGENRFLEHCKRNINSIHDIITAKGIEGVNKLYSDYGITHFGRYPAELLIDQLEERNEPYGIWLGPYSDYNGGFHQNKEHIAKLAREARNLGLGIRIIEARGKLSVVRRLKGLDKKFGDKNKIAYAVVCGHGSPELVRLGNNKDDGLTVEDLKKESAQKLKSVYEENLPFFFISCSTGQGLDSISNQYSAYGGGYSVGPDVPGYLQWMHLYRDTGGKLYFEGGYGGDDQVTASVFKAGAEAAGELLEDKEKMYEANYRGMLGDEVTMKELWEDRAGKNSSVLLEILDREKLVPLKNRLRERFGERRVELRFGFKIRNVDTFMTTGEILDVNLKNNNFSQGFGSAMAEHFERLSKLAYVNLRGRGNIIPFAEVEGEQFEIDMQDLYPENIGVAK